MEQPHNTRPIGTILLRAIVVLMILIAIIIVNYKINRLEDRTYTAPITNRFGMQSNSINITNSQIVYVPVYSHIYSTGGEPQLLEITLSIRNSDPQNNITLLSARYYDTQGKKLQEYLEEKIILKPLQSTEILIKQEDARGGSGANFILEWVADIPVYEPVIEAIMIGSDKNGISFKSFGRPLSKRAN